MADTKKRPAARKAAPKKSAKKTARPRRERCLPNPAPTGNPQPPRSQSFGRGKALAANLFSEFAYDELADGLRGLMEGVRESLSERIRKEEKCLDHMHEAMSVAEER